MDRMRECAICGYLKNDNLVILGKAICSDCEWRMVRLRAHDAGYQDYVNSMKKLINKPTGSD